MLQTVSLIKLPINFSDYYVFLVTFFIKATLMDPAIAINGLNAKEIKVSCQE